MKELLFLCVELINQNSLLESLRVLFIPWAFSGRGSLTESAVGVLTISRNGGMETIAANDDISAVKIDKVDLGVFILFHSCKFYFSFAKIAKKELQSNFWEEKK